MAPLGVGSGVGVAIAVGVVVGVADGVTVKVAVGTRLAVAVGWLVGEGSWLISVEEVGCDGVLQLDKRRTAVTKKQQNRIRAVRLNNKVDTLSQRGRLHPELCLSGCLFRGLVCWRTLMKPHLPFCRGAYPQRRTKRVPVKIAGWADVG